MQKKQAERALSTLYLKVEYLDDLQERIVDISIKLDKLEKEINLYEKLDMGETLEEYIHSTNMEYKGLRLERTILEDKMNEICLDETLRLIAEYEEELTI